MKKIIAITTIILMLTAALAGCVQQPITPLPEKTEEQTIAPGSSTEPSIEPMPEQTPEETVLQPKIAADNIDKEQISRFFDLSMGEIIELLGNNYEIVQTGSEGVVDGYEYIDLGLTFVFTDFDDDVDDDSELEWIEPAYYNKEDWTEHSKLYDIYGLNKNMDFNQIEKALGEKGERSEGWQETPDHKIYILNIKMKNYTLTFNSFTKDGADQWMYCFSNK